jgi:hypothetical protein
MIMKLKNHLYAPKWEQEKGENTNGEGDIHTHEKCLVIWISGCHRGKRIIFWNVSPSGPVHVHLRFGGIYCLHLPGLRRSNCRLLLVVYLLGLFFDREDGGNMCLQNVGEFMPDCTALHSRTQHFMQPVNTLYSAVSAVVCE